MPTGYIYCEGNDAMMTFKVSREEAQLVWVLLHPSPGNLQLASSEQLYDPLPDGDKWTHMRSKAQNADTAALTCVITQQ